MISIIIPTIRPQNIPALLESIEENTSIEHETLWSEDIHGAGTPRMVKSLVKIANHDWIAFLGDDTFPEKYCIDYAFKMALKEDLLLVGFNDHDTGKATHWLANKKLLDYLENREFFYTGYIHNFCDDELRIRAEELGKYKWCEEARIIHNHPTWTGIHDDSYEKQTNNTNWNHDRDLFLKRNRK